MSPRYQWAAAVAVVAARGVGAVGAAGQAADPVGREEEESVFQAVVRSCLVLAEVADMGLTHRIPRERPLSPAIQAATPCKWTGPPPLKTRLPGYASGMRCTSIYPMERNRWSCNRY